jgi:hypothetical protein
VDHYLSLKPEKAEKTHGTNARVGMSTEKDKFQALITNRIPQDFEGSLAEFFQGLETSVAA